MMCENKNYCCVEMKEHASIDDSRSIIESVSVQNRAFSFSKSYSRSLMTPPWKTSHRIEFMSVGIGRERSIDQDSWVEDTIVQTSSKFLENDFRLWKGFDPRGISECLRSGMCYPKEV